MAAQAELLGVHFLTTEDEDLARLFGGETGGQVLDRHDAGDHVVFVLEPVLAEQGEPVRPFPFHRAKRIDPGHEA